MSRVNGRLGLRTDPEEFRVYGPPGTGKTTWLADHAGQDAESYGADQVSVCSLTNAAVREAVGRDLPLDKENVTTLHARCKRSLVAPPPAESLIDEFIREYPAMVRSLPESLVRGKPSDEDEAETILSGGRLTPYERLNLNRQMLIPGDQWDHDVTYFAKHWLDFCLQMGHGDYTSWLEDARDKGTLPIQQVVYVDEAQDHTPLQLDVIRKWRTRKLILVGDDDQNLYEWSGALPEAFLHPELDKGHEETLEQSYRVPAKIHSLAVRWISQAMERHPKVYRPREGDPGRIEMPQYSGEDAKDRGELPPGLLQEEGSYMILASCGYMLDPLVSLLKTSGIPFHNPYRVANKKWNPLDSSREKLMAFVKEGRWTGDEVASWASVLKTGVFRRGMRERFLPWCEKMGDRPIEDEYLESVFQDQVLERILRRDLTIFTDHRRTGLTGSWDYAVRVMQRPDRQPRLIVGTIHSVKGGQADHVYLLPDLSRAGGYEYGMSDTRDRIIRLFYVGMTRARESLHLLSPTGAGHTVRWGPAPV